MKARVSISGQNAPEWDYFMEQIMNMNEGLNNPSTILLSWQVCNAYFSDMKHIQVKYGVDRLLFVYAGGTHPKPYTETMGKAKNRRQTL